MTPEYAPGTTPLDPDEAVALIPDLTTQGELNEWEQANVLEGQRWAFTPGNHEDPLTDEFVRKLHKKMFGETWTTSGRMGRGAIRPSSFLAVAYRSGRKWCANVYSSVRAA